MEYMQSMADKCVNLTLTDIPYGEVNRKSSGVRSFNKEEADVIDFDLEAFCDHICRVTSGSIYVFCGIEQVSQIRKRLKDNGMTTRHCVWEKTNPSPVNGQHMWLSSIENCVFGRWGGGRVPRALEVPRLAYAFGHGW